MLKKRILNGRYTSFTGHYFKDANFKQGEIVDFTVNINSIDGKLTVKVVDLDGKLVSQFNKNTSLKILMDGTYKIQVVADHHEGSFSVNWKVE